MKNLAVLLFALSTLTVGGNAFARSAQVCSDKGECAVFHDIDHSCTGSVCFGGVMKSKVTLEETTALPVTAPKSILEWCQNNDESCRTSNDCCGGSMCHDMHDGKGSVCW